MMQGAKRRIAQAFKSTGRHEGKEPLEVFRRHTRRWSGHEVWFSIPTPIDYKEWGANLAECSLQLFPKCRGRLHVVALFLTQGE